MSLAKPSTREREKRSLPPGDDERFRPAFPVIASKLTAPPSRFSAVQRDRVLQTLADTDAAVVSIVAPPGYGKTTLLSQWAATYEGSVAWLTVDPVDNDPVVLVGYLGAAFDAVSSISPETARALTAGPRRILPSAVPLLLTELSKWPKPALIVIDDAHVLTESTGLDVLSAFVDHLPSGCRIALAGRQQLKLPLGRIAAERDLLDLGRVELALDADEASALLKAAGFQFAADEVEALVARTEGWAAGLYLAAKALSGDGARRDPASTVHGSDGYVAAYFRAEVQGGLEPDDLTFLARTSVLDRVTASAADHVAELPDSAQRLRRMSDANRLVQELSADEPTYRYHNLLREFLALELEVREPGATRLMHRRASAWFDSIGDTDLAIEHALAGLDFHAAAKSVTAAAYSAHQRGRTATLDRWLSAFDQAEIARHPSLAVIAAWVYLLTGRGDEADAMADVAERADYHGSPGDGSASFASQRAMLRAMMARSGPADALANAKISVALERPGSPWRSTALMLEASAHEMMGDPDAADLAYVEAIGVGAVTSASTVMNALARRAALRISAGDWAAAEELIERADALRELWRFDNFVTVLYVHALAARIAIQRGDFDLGRERLVSAQLVRPLANHAAPFMSVDSLLNLSRAYLAMSDPAGAQVALREAEVIVRRRPSLGNLTTELVEVRNQLADATATLLGSSALTSAELRVLPFLPTYLSFQEIAERLLISRNTVKTHAMSIYGKLWASSRGEAVERAVEMGLLEPYPALTRATAPAPAPATPHLRLLRTDEREDERGDDDVVASLLRGG